MKDVLEKLSDGDLRSEGRASEVAAEVTADHSLLPDLVQGLRSADKIIRARTCMAMEVISRRHPALLQDLVPRLIELAATDRVPQVRWHIAEIFANVPLPADEAERIIPILLEYLKDRSKIVRYCAVQTLGILGRESPSRPKIAAQIAALQDDSKSLNKAVTQALQHLGVD
jgi:HEAT repeat protein